MDLAGNWMMGLAQDVAFNAFTHAPARFSSNQHICTLDLYIVKGAFLQTFRGSMKLLFFSLEPDDTLKTL